MQQRPGKLHGRDDAYELALRALNRNERSEAELDAWLAHRGVGQAERAEVLALLAEAGAVDDERFARRFAEDKRELAGWGPDRIAESLAKRGISQELIDAALAAETDDELAGRAAELLVRSGAEVTGERGRQRALGLLVRRGFPLEIAYDAIRGLQRNG
jgi:regulatory protein